MPYAMSTNEQVINFAFRSTNQMGATLLAVQSGLNSLTAVAGSVGRGLSDAMSTAQSGALALGTMTLMAMGQAIGAATEYQAKMAQVKAISGQSTEEVNNLGNSAQQLSMKYGMSLNDVTDGLITLGRAGIDNATVQTGVLEEGFKMAKLEGMSLNDALEDLVTTTNLLNNNGVDMNSEEYTGQVQEMNTKLLTASQVAPIDVKNVIDSLQYAGGAAAVSNMDQDNLLATISALGARGTKGAMAGTALRNFMTRSITSTGENALESIGLSGDSLWKFGGDKMRSFSDMKRMLDETMEERGMTTQDQLGFWAKFAGPKMANQLMKIDPDQVEQYEEKISEGADINEQMNTILTSTKETWNEIISAVTNFMVNVGSKFLTIINPVVQAFRTILGLFSGNSLLSELFGWITSGVMVSLLAGGASALFNLLMPSLASLHKKGLGLKGVVQDIGGEVLKTKKTWESIKNPKSLEKKARAYNETELENIRYFTAKTEMPSRMADPFKMREFQNLDLLQQSLLYNKKGMGDITNSKTLLPEGLIRELTGNDEFSYSKYGGQDKYMNKLTEFIEGNKVLPKKDPSSTNKSEDKKQVTKETQENTKAVRETAKEQGELKKSVKDSTKAAKDNTNNTNNINKTLNSGVVKAINTKGGAIIRAIGNITKLLYDGGGKQNSTISPTSQSQSTKKQKTSTSVKQKSKNIIEEDESKNVSSLPKTSKVIQVGLTGDDKSFLARQGIPEAYMSGKNKEAVIMEYLRKVYDDDSASAFHGNFRAATINGFKGNAAIIEALDMLKKSHGERLSQYASGKIEEYALGGDVKSDVRAADEYIESLKINQRKAESDNEKRKQLQLKNVLNSKSQDSKLENMDFILSDTVLKEIAGLTTDAEYGIATDESITNVQTLIKNDAEEKLNNFKQSLIEHKLQGIIEDNDNAATNKKELQSTIQELENESYKAKTDIIKALASNRLSEIDETLTENTKKQNGYKGTFQNEALDEKTRNKARLAFKKLGKENKYLRMEKKDITKNATSYFMDSNNYNPYKDELAAVTKELKDKNALKSGKDNKELKKTIQEQQNIYNENKANLERVNQEIADEKNNELIKTVNKAFVTSEQHYNKNQEPKRYKNGNIVPAQKDGTQPMQLSKHGLVMIENTQKRLIKAIDSSIDPNTSIKDINISEWNKTASKENKELVKAVGVTPLSSKANINKKNKIKEEWQDKPKKLQEQQTEYSLKVEESSQYLEKHAESIKEFTGLDDNIAILKHEKKILEKTQKNFNKIQKNIKDKYAEYNHILESINNAYKQIKAQENLLMTTTTDMYEIKSGNIGISDKTIQSAMNKYVKNLINPLDRLLEESVNNFYKTPFLRWNEVAQNIDINTMQRKDKETRKQYGNNATDEAVREKNKIGALSEQSGIKTITENRADGSFTDKQMLYGGGRQFVLGGDTGNQWIPYNPQDQKTIGNNFDDMNNQKAIAIYNNLVLEIEKTSEKIKKINNSLNIQQGYMTNKYIAKQIGPLINQRNSMIETFHRDYIGFDENITNGVNLLPDWGEKYRFDQEAKKIIQNSIGHQIYPIDMNDSVRFMNKTYYNRSAEREQKKGLVFHTTIDDEPTSMYRHENGFKIIKEESHNIPYGYNNPTVYKRQHISSVNDAKVLQDVVAYWKNGKEYTIANDAKALQDAQSHKITNLSLNGGLYAEETNSILKERISKMVGHNMSGVDMPIDKEDYYYRGGHKIYRGTAENENITKAIADANQKFIKSITLDDIKKGYTDAAGHINKTTQAKDSRYNTNGFNLPKDIDQIYADRAIKEGIDDIHQKSKKAGSEFAKPFWDRYHKAQHDNIQGYHGVGGMWARGADNAQATGQAYWGMAKAGFHTAKDTISAAGNKAMTKSAQRARNAISNLGQQMGMLAGSISPQLSAALMTGSIVMDVASSATELLTVARAGEATLLGILNIELLAFIAPILIIIGVILAWKNAHDAEAKAAKEKVEETGKEYDKHQKKYEYYTKQVNKNRDKYFDKLQKEKALLEQTANAYQYAGQREINTEKDDVWGGLGFAGTIARRLGISNDDDIKKRSKDTTSEITEMVDKDNQSNFGIVPAFPVADLLGMGMRAAGIQPKNMQLQSDITGYYNQHEQQFQEMNQYKPELSTLYNLQNSLMDTGLTATQAQNSAKFQEALQGVTQKTGMSAKKIKSYLQWMQGEQFIKASKEKMSSDADYDKNYMASTTTALWTGQTFDDLENLKGMNDTQKKMLEVQALQYGSEVASEAGWALIKLYILQGVTFLEWIFLHISGKDGNGEIGKNEKKQGSIQSAINKMQGLTDSNTNAETYLNAVDTSSQRTDLESGESADSTNSSTNTVNKPSWSGLGTSGSSSSSYSSSTLTSGSSSTGSSSSGSSSTGSSSTTVTPTAVSADTTSTSLEQKKFVITGDWYINTTGDPDDIKSQMMQIFEDISERINPKVVSQTSGTPPTTTANSSTGDANTDSTSGIQDGVTPATGDEKASRSNYAKVLSNDGTNVVLGTHDGKKIIRKISDYSFLKNSKKDNEYSYSKLNVN